MMEVQFYVNIILGYNWRFRLGENCIVFIDIFIKFYMRRFKEFLEGDGKIGIVGGFEVYWIDFCFVWKCIDYGGDFFNIFLLVFDIWILNFVLMNLYYSQYVFM